MARVNTKNAHIRKDTQPDKTNEVAADDAQRILEDPAFVRGFDETREGIIKLLEEIRHDGSDDMNNYERELCRTLRSLTCIKRIIGLGVQRQQLRAVDFKPQQKEAE